MTIHPNQRFPNYLYQQIDRIHLMAYDMVSRGGRQQPEHHATLDKTKKAIEFLIGSQHVDGDGLRATPEKLMLGIPAYARNMYNPSNVKTFAELYDDIIGTGYDNKTNMDSSTMMRKHAWDGYEWDSPARVQEKVRLAKQYGLGGVFFWEIGQDKVTKDYPEGILLHAAATAAFSDAEDGHDEEVGSSSLSSNTEEL
jgi:GH18 family chitinase